MIKVSLYLFDGVAENSKLFGVCVFDIGGNKFRLVAFVGYAKSKVYVLRVMTHREYDRGNQQWKHEL